MTFFPDYEFKPSPQLILPHVNMEPVSSEFTVGMYREMMSMFKSIDYNYNMKRKQQRLEFTVEDIEYNKIPRRYKSSLGISIDDIVAEHSFTSVIKGLVPWTVEYKND